MMHFFAPLIVALATAFGASLGHAEVRIGVAAPLTGPMGWAEGELRRPPRLRSPTSTPRAVSSASRSR